MSTDVTVVNMDNLAKIDFLEEKSRLLVEREPRHAAFDTALKPSWEQMRKKLELPRHLRDAEVMLDLAIQTYLGVAGARDIERELKRKFGVGKLGDAPEQLAKRAVKRGKVLDMDEAEILKHVIADGELRDGLGEKFMTKLERIFAAFEDSLRKKK